MTPQDQEFTYRPEIGQSGDCARAVLASLLDLPIADVPHFAQLAREDGQFYGRINEFLEDRGFEMLWNVTPIYHLKDGVEIFHYMAGPSPRGNGIWHAVVGCNAEIAFDPHPEKTGLSGDPSRWQHSFLKKISNDTETTI